MFGDLHRKINVSQWSVGCVLIFLRKTLINHRIGAVLIAAFIACGYVSNI